MANSGWNCPKMAPKMAQMGLKRPNLEFLATFKSSTFDPPRFFLAVAFLMRFWPYLTSKNFASLQNLPLDPKLPKWPQNCSKILELQSNPNLVPVLSFLSQFWIFWPKVDFFWNFLNSPNFPNFPLDPKWPKWPQNCSKILEFQSHPNLVPVLCFFEPVLNFLTQNWIFWNFLNSPNFPLDPKLPKLTQNCSKILEFQSHPDLVPVLSFLSRTLNFLSKSWIFLEFFWNFGNLTQNGQDWHLNIDSLLSGFLERGFYPTAERLKESNPCKAANSPWRRLFHAVKSTFWGFH